MVAVASDIWWQTFIRLGFTSGLRVGEMLNLTWPDIDEPNGQVIVSAKRAGRFQVGDEDYPILPWSCKSHRERRVPLHPDAAALLANLRMKAGASRYVFLSLQRLRRIESSTDVTREIPANGLVKTTCCGRSRRSRAKQGLYLSGRCTISARATGHTCPIG